MAKRLISLFLIVLIIYACPAPKPKSYEVAVNWFNPSYCNPYLKYHPGDYIKAEDDFINVFIKESGCGSDCRKELLKSDDIFDQEEIAKPSVAYHIEGGYYSDGSYFAGCRPFIFTNIHPTRDKYKKTQWQKDRDDCMKLTSENVKYERAFLGLSFRWDNTRYYKRGKDYFKNCLKESGYLN